MCCKFKDGAVEALEGLIKRRGRFDAIVIETSGLADPSPLVQMFWQDVQLESPVELDGVATLIDAQRILYYLGRASAKGGDKAKAGDHAQSEDGGFVEASQQIALADRLIINKLDLVDNATVQKVVEVLRNMNPTAPIELSTYGRECDLAALLALRRATAPESAADDLAKARGLRSFVPDPWSLVARSLVARSLTRALARTLPSRRGMRSVVPPYRTTHGGCRNFVGGG